MQLAPVLAKPKKANPGVSYSQGERLSSVHTSQAPLFTSAAIAVEAPTKAPTNGMDAIDIAAANVMPFFMSFMVSSFKSFPQPTRRGLTGGITEA